jgi:hypothetical protein
MSNVLTQYAGTVYDLLPGKRVGWTVWMANEEILWAAALPSYGEDHPDTTYTGMVVNLTNKVKVSGERTARFETVNTGQIATTFDVYIAWTDGPADF